MQRHPGLTSRDHQSSVYLLNNLVQALRCDEPQFITESQPGMNGRRQYRIMIKLAISDTNMDTTSPWAQITKLTTERDQAIVRTRSLTDELDRMKRELEETKRRIHANDFICPICMEPVLKETAMALDCRHVICERCKISWTTELAAESTLGYRCPTCNLHSTPVRLF